MKKLFLLIALMPLLALNAQDNKSAEKTLFDTEGEVHVSGYGAPELLFSQILGSETGLFMGGRGGAIFNSTFILGGGGYGLVTSHPFIYNDPVSGNDLDAYFNMGYGGLHIGYINNSDDVIHYTISALIGGGGASYINSRNYPPQSGDYRTYESSGFFVIQPNIGMELNLFTFFRMEVSAGYRLCLGSTLSQHGDADLSGIYGGLALKFGAF